MPSTINADNGVSSGSAGLKSTADSSGVLSLQTNGTTAVTVDTSQNVGIGTSSPVAPLTLGNNKVFAWPNAAGGYNGSTTGTQLLKFSDNNLYIDNLDASTNTIFRRNGPTESMRIDSSGNLGIGTSSPGYRLHVSQSVAGGFTWSAVDNQNSTAGSASGFITIANGAGNYSYFSQGINGNLILLNNKAATTLWTATANPIIFYTNLTEAARIDSSGNLLVGTTAPLNGSRFYTIATGSAIAGGFKNDTAGYQTIQVWNAAAAGTRNLIQFSAGTGGTSVGTVSTDGTNTTYGTSSDYRLKENIQPMTGALEKVAQLKPCTYTWKGTGALGQGFIAHELQAVVPDAVVGEKDAVNEDGSIRPQNIDTSFLVATLTAAIQELKAEVDSLKSQLAAKG